MAAVIDDDSRTALPAGTVLHGAYEVRSQIDHGGFGIVYSALHRELRLPVAIKEYFPVDLSVREEGTVHPRSRARGDDFNDGLDRFLGEAQSLTKFRDLPNIVSCSDFFRENGTAYIVMDFEDGMSLRDLLEMREDQGRPFGEDDLLAVIMPVLRGLKKVHDAGVLHRDIKPSNILIRKEANREEDRPVLIDFGAAKQKTAGMSRSYAPYTNGYAAIEQVAGGALGPWTDIYAVGAVMWRMVAGARADSVSRVPAKVEARLAAFLRGDPDPLPSAQELGDGRYSKGLLKTIDRCLDLREENRVQDCDELARLLQPEEPAGEDLAPVTAKPSRSVTRQAWIMALVAVGVAGVTLALALGVGIGGGPGPDPTLPPGGDQSQEVEAAEGDGVTGQIGTDSGSGADNGERVSAATGALTGRETVRPAESFGEQNPPVAGLHPPRPKGTKPGAVAERGPGTDAGTSDPPIITGPGLGRERSVGSDDSPADASAESLAASEGVRRELTNSIGMEFVLVPEGSFRMGSPQSEADREEDEGPVHEVTISQPFYLGKHEVTQGQWKALMSGNPSAFDRCGDSCPVENVSWNDASEFIRELNKREGGERYRLPTEAEWEYAARAGADAPPFLEPLKITAWYDGTSEMKTHPVGHKNANAFGLHDMLGNVWEWVSDRYGDYSNRAATDPQGPGTGSQRAYRGGGWYLGPEYCRPASRRGSSPGARRGNLGFRVLRTAQ